MQKYIPFDPFHHSKILKGQPRGFACWERAPNWCKSFSINHYDWMKMNDSSMLSNTNSTQTWRAAEFDAYSYHIVKNCATSQGTIILDWVGRYMYINVYIYTCIYIYIYINVHTHIYLHIHVRMHIYILNIHIHIHMYIYIYINIHIYIYT